MAFLMAYCGEQDNGTGDGGHGGGQDDALRSEKGGHDRKRPRGGFG